MKCGRCGTEVNSEDASEHNGRQLCEDCYMDALSPTRVCDPWAVHSAKSFEKYSGVAAVLTPIQTEILAILKETGGIDPPSLLLRFGDKLNIKDLEREFSVLRHMEKARGEKQGGRVIWRIW